MRTQNTVCFRIFGLLSGILLLCSTIQAETNDYKSVKSLFTDALIKTSKKISSDQFNSSTPPISLDCFETSDQELYIGVKQMMDIDASLIQVEAIINDIDHYRDLFPGLKQTKILSRDGNKIKIFWEQNVPIPFVPNIKYEMIYVLETPTEGQRLYHYHLHEQGALKFSDGFILLKKINDHLTRYVEYDFFDAEWGPAKILGKTKLWYDAVEGLAHSDLAVKLKAENPSWSHQQSKKEAGFLLRSEKIDERINRCIKNKIKTDLEKL